MKPRLNITLAPDVVDRLRQHQALGLSSMSEMVEVAIRQYCNIKEVPMDKESLTAFVAEEVTKRLRHEKDMWLVTIQRDCLDALYRQLASTYPDRFGELDPEASGNYDVPAEVEPPVDSWSVTAEN